MGACCCTGVGGLSTSINDVEGVVFLVIVCRGRFGGADDADEVGSWSDCGCCDDCVRSFGQSAAVPKGKQLMFN